MYGETFYGRHTAQHQLQWMLPDPRIEPATVRMLGGRTCDRTTGPGHIYVCFGNIVFQNVRLFF